MECDDDLNRKKLLYNIARSIVFVDYMLLLDVVGSRCEVDGMEYLFIYFRSHPSITHAHTICDVFILCKNKIKHSTLTPSFPNPLGGSSVINFLL